MVLLRRESICYIPLAKTLKFNIKDNEDAAWIILLSIDKCHVHEILLYTSGT